MALPDVARHAPRAADARHHRHLIEIVTGFLDGGHDGAENGADPATRTPDVGNPLHAQQGVFGMDRQLLGGFPGRHLFSFNAF
jgi:hypothetical protein